MAQLKTQAPEHSLHGNVLRQEICDHPLAPFQKCDLHQTPYQLCTQTALLKGVAHYDSRFRFVIVMDLYQPPYTDDLALARGGVFSLGYQRYFTVIVDKTDTREPVVGNALAETHHVEESQIDAAVGERLVEANQQGLVLG